MLNVVTVLSALKDSREQDLTVLLAGVQQDFLAALIRTVTHNTTPSFGLCLKRRGDRPAHLSD
jgi:hypothetical protein